MTSALQALAVFLPVAYLATAVLFGMSFAGDKAPSGSRPWSALALWTTIALHLAFFSLYWRVSGALPMYDTWLLVSASVLTTALLFALQSLRGGMASVGCIVLAAVFMLQLFASAFGPLDAPVVRRVTDVFTLLHVGTSLLAIAALVLSGLYGGVHLLLYRQMRKKHFGAVFSQLPNLEMLADLTRQAALIGFLVLTVATNVGIAIAHARDTEGFNYTDPHVLVFLALWLHFGLIASSKRIGRMTARHSSFAAVAGLVVVVLGLLMMALPSWTFHSIS
jgi:ABC-type uncharacterized transport system permease subunit